MGLQGKDYGTVLCRIAASREEGVEPKAYLSKCLFPLYDKRKLTADIIIALTGSR